MRTCQMQDRVRFEMANIKQTRLAEHEGLKLMRFLRFALRKTRAFFLQVHHINLYAILRQKIKFEEVKNA